MKINQQKLWDCAAAFGGGLFLMLCKGFEYLAHNQTSYFIYGTRLSDPAFIPRDWFTWQTFHHDFAFAGLFCGLTKLGPPVITTVLADLMFLSLLAYGVLMMCRMFSQNALIVYAALITWLGVISHSEIGLGGQYLFHGFLQPSEVAGCLMVFGLALLLARRFLTAGIVLGFAGMFHGSYLVSFAPAIAVTAIAVGVLRSWRSALSFGIPMAVLWGTFVIIVSRAFAQSSPPTQETIAIMTQLRAPGDFILSQWPLDWTLNWFIWAGLGVFAMLTLSSEEKTQGLKFCFFTLLLTSVLSIVQAMWIQNQSITMMMLWRSSPMVLILGQLVVIDRLVRILLEPQNLKRVDQMFIGLAAVAAVILLNSQWGIHSNRRFLWIMAFPSAFAAAWVSTKFFKNRWPVSRVVTVVLVGLMVMIMVRTSYRGIVTSHNYETHPIPASVGEMEQWVKTHTPKDAIFVVPPDMEYMRVRGRRAIVVDWSSSCYLPSNLLQWYQRLCDISGVPSKPLVKDYHVFDEGYRRLDLARAKQLKNLYGADYVVVSARHHQGDLEGLREKFVNEDYRVLAIP